jgi:hypothetical protein
LSEENGKKLERVGTSYSNTVDQKLERIIAMRQIALIGAMAGLLMVGAFGCGKQGGNDSQSKAEHARDEFVKGLQDTVDSLQAKMNKLGDMAAAKGSEAKAKYDTEVKPALEKKLDQTKAVLAKVKAESGTAWEDTKDAAQSAVNGLKAAYDDAAKMFE